MNTKTELYERNKKWHKILTIANPIVFWILLALSALCLFLAIQNSLGNISEVIEKLDAKNLTGDELSANYAYLSEKYGEWKIGNGSKGFEITFIDIRNAAFGGFAVMNAFMFFVFFVSAFLLGKLILPAVKDKIEQENQDMVNLTILNGEKNG